MFPRWAIPVSRSSCQSWANPANRIEEMSQSGRSGDQTVARRVSNKVLFTNSRLLGKFAQRGPRNAAHRVSDSNVPRRQRSRDPSRH